MKRINLSTVIASFFLVVIFSCGNQSTTNSVRSNDTITADTTNNIPGDTLHEKVEDSKGPVSSWVVRPKESKVAFTIKNFGAEVQGSLGGLKATIHFSEDNLSQSSFEASVPVSSINTGNNKRDKDLMHTKYFDTEHYPEITFRSDSILKSDKGYLSKGTLTIKGKSSHKEIPFSFEQKENTAIFTSQFSLKRLDYGIGGTGPIMGEDINVSLYVVAEKH